MAFLRSHLYKRAYLASQATTAIPLYISQAGIINGDDDLLALSANDVLAGKFFPGTEAGLRAGTLCRRPLKEADKWGVASLAQKNVRCLAPPLLRVRVR